MFVGYLFLAGRVIGLGLERPLIKSLGQGRNSVAATTLYFGISLVMLAIVAAFQWAADPQYASSINLWIGAALLSGVFYAISFHTYVWALIVGEVSYLSPLYAVAFVFLYAMDLAFGGATFALHHAAGILAVALGVVFLNYTPRTSGGQPRWGAWLAALDPRTVLRQPGAWGMLVYAFGLSCGRLIDKSAAGVAPPVLYALINNSHCVIAGIVILALSGKVKLVRDLFVERPWIALVGALMGQGAYVLMLFALDYFNPSTVEPVSQLSVFIAVGLGGLWFGEQTRTRWLPSALVVAGAALLLA